MISIREAERWAISILDTIETHALREDALVEIKAEWPESYRASRRIAGQANAACGSEILWIIGADELRGVLGVQAPDLAVWLPSVWRHFEGPHPAVIDLQIERSGAICTAMVFDTTRAPFVVRNPEFGSRQGVVIEREVPWRDGTRIRSATRDDILRVLMGTFSAPSVEILYAKGFLHEQAFRGEKQGGYVGARFLIEFYVMPRSHDPLVIPHHRNESFLIPSDDHTPRTFHRFQYTSKESDLRSIRNVLAYARSPQGIDASGTDGGLEDTGSELLITRACHVRCYADVELPEESWNNSETFDGQITYFIGPDRIPFVVAFRATRK